MSDEIVPAGATELEVIDTPKTFLTTFSAESACTGSAGDWCSVQILVDGIPMIPAADDTLTR